MQGDGLDIGGKEQKPSYEIEGQQAGRDINQAGRDIIIVSNLPITAESELKKANLEMIVRGNKICVQNKGPAKAIDIKVFINDVPEEADNWNCFVNGDLHFRKSLKPGQETHRLIAPSVNCHRSINYKITWKNEDDTSGMTVETDFRLF